MAKGIYSKKNYTGENISLKIVLSKVYKVYIGSVWNSFDLNVSAPVVDIRCFLRIFIFSVDTLKTNKNKYFDSDE